MSFAVFKVYISVLCLNANNSLVETVKQLINKNYIGCPTRYRTRHFFNNFTTNEDIRRTTDTHTTDTFLFISHTTNELLFKFRCNIFIGVRIIKEMPGSVASGTPCTYIHTFHGSISVMKTAGCGTSHKHTNIPMYSVQHYKHFTQQYYKSSLHIKKSSTEYK